MNIYQLKPDEDFKMMQMASDTFGSLPKEINSVSILLVREGNCEVNINLTSYSIIEDSVLIVYPNDIIETVKCTDNFNADLLMIGKKLFGEGISRFETSVVEVFFKNRVIHGTNGWGDGDTRKFFLNTFENMSIISNANESYYRYEEALCLLRGLLCYGADQIRKSNNMKPQSTFNRLEEHFNSFITLLFTDYKISREVSYYANKMNLSAKYLNYITSEIGKRTCKSIIDNYVVLKLRNELRTTQKSIQEIAYEYNFPNQSFLGCYFKKFEGCSPRKYRSGSE